MKTKAPIYPPLEKVGSSTCGLFPIQLDLQRLYRNQEKIYAVLTDLAAKMDFEHGYRDARGQEMAKLPFGTKDNPPLQGSAQRERDLLSPG
jgi:hypothetical protein